MWPECRDKELKLSHRRLPFAYVLGIMDSNHHYSSLENMVVMSGFQPICYLMSFLDPLTLARLGQACTLLRNTVKYYQCRTWNIKGLLSRYIDPIFIGNLRYHLKDSSALIFGPAVLEFLDRSVPFPDEDQRLDIAVPCGRATWLLGTFLTDQGYMIKGGEFKFERDVLRDNRKAESFATGDRLASEEHYESKKYILSKLKKKRPPTPDLRSCVIILHSVNCDPYLHVLSQHSTALMNFISFEGVVSLFPRTTFFSRCSLVARTRHLQSDDEPLSGKLWLEDYLQVNRLRVIGSTSWLVQGVELGHRHLADKYCWTIRFDQSTSDNITHKFRGLIPDIFTPPFTPGPSFEVHDWFSGTTALDSYLRIGQPYVLRAWAKLRKNPPTYNYARG